jgi:fumarate hydratase, class II
MMGGMQHSGEPPGGGGRIERDAMGEVAVPAGARYGAETARAAAWSFGEARMPIGIVRAIGQIKAASARVNGAAGRLPPDVAASIERAAVEVADGRHDEQFVLGVFQTGSGTSSHMNANEVIANRAAELLGASRGAVDAHDHVNIGQSSNDVVPSAVLLAALALGERRLMPAFAGLVAELHTFADRLWNDVRNGRTHLMAAMPIRFGQQFRGAAQQIETATERLAAAVEACRALPLGGTAVGTGAACPAGMPAAVCHELGEMFGLRVHVTDRPLGAVGGLGAIAWFGAALRGAALSLYKIVDDVRWQASDAFGELELPPMQPGSSIMVGKVNPVVCEAVLMACAQVIGNEAVIAFAETQGRFELNTMIPVAAHNLLASIDLMTGAVDAFRDHALTGLRVRPGAAAAVTRNPILATALAPEIGHRAAAEIAREAVERGVGVFEVARERGVLPEAQLRELLDPARLCGERGATAAADRGTNQSAGRPVRAPDGGTTMKHYDSKSQPAPGPDPRDVLHDPTLTREEKIAKLRRWSYDARELEVANEEGMGGPPKPSNLPAILEALQELGATDDSSSHKQ